MRQVTNFYFSASLFTIMVATVTILATIVSAQERSAQERQKQPRQFEPAPVQQSGAPNTPTVIVSPDEDYRIGPSDVIEVSVQDAPELSGNFRVNAAGTFQMPFLGEINAQEKTTEELSKYITDGLRDKYLRTPQVAIAVKQINSRSFFIQGSIRRPGLYQIEGTPTLLKLITVAGGLSENYGSTAFIIREIKQTKASVNASETNNNSDISAGTPGGAEIRPNANSKSVKPVGADNDGMADYELITANINSLLRGNFDQNVPVKAGDIVHIPPADVFFVAGEVNSPGSFQLKEATTLRQAISLAQGVTLEAATGNGIIFREDSTTGKRQELNVDIAAVMSGKKDDIPVKANDIIMVPHSRFKSVTYGFLKAFGWSLQRRIIWQ